MKQWINRQLKHLDHLDNCPPGEMLESQYADPQRIVDEAARLAAKAGLPKAVEACGKVRSINGARRALAAVLAEIEDDPNAPLGPAQAAARLNISVRQFYVLCEKRKIRHQRNPIRVLPADIAAYLGT